MADNTHSIEFIKASGQYGYKTDTPALSPTGDITIDGNIRLRQLPSTAAAFFEMMSKYLTTGGHRSFLFDITNVDKIRFFYYADGGSANYENILTDAAVFDADDIWVWVHIAITVDVSAKTAIIYKDLVVQENSVIENGSGATSIHDGDADFVIGAIDGGALPIDADMNNWRLWEGIKSPEFLAANWKTVRTDVGVDGLIDAWYYEDSHNSASGNANLTAVGAPSFSQRVPFVGDGNALGGDILLSGGKTIHTFTNNGDFVVPGTGEVEYLIIAGGGAGGTGVDGGPGGGGGAGGFQTDTGHAITAQTYSITVGDGGSTDDGEDSVFDTITSIGGGAGADYHSERGHDGGSGGGTYWVGGTGTGGTGTVGQGHDGGVGIYTPNYNASGGGGAGTVGGNAGTNGGNGGNGEDSSISGGSVTYAGGGGGGVWSGAGGSGGTGGGGNGSVGRTGNGFNATGYGSGGGGAGSYNGQTGGTGSSGIVIISYVTDSISTGSAFVPSMYRY